MEKRRLSKEMFITTFVITTIIFLVGIFLGSTLEQSKITSLEVTVGNLRSKIENVELEFLFLDTTKGNISCKYFIEEAKVLGSEADELAKEVIALENSRKIEEDKFRSMKSEYTLTLIRDWLTLEKIKQTCTSDYFTVIYFYSEECDLCEQQGFLLSYFKLQDPEKVMIFAIDKDLDLPIVNAIQSSYEVSEYPSIVIDAKLYSGFQDKEKLKDILCSYNSNMAFC
jgi:hypothetical protein